MTYSYSDIIYISTIYQRYMGQPFDIIIFCNNRRTEYIKFYVNYN